MLKGKKIMLTRIQNVNFGVSRMGSAKKAQTQNATTSYAQNSIPSKAASMATKANALNLAKTLSFTASLGDSMKFYSRDMQTCGKEYVGSVVDVSKLLFNTQDDRTEFDDAQKSTTKISLGSRDRYIRHQTKALGNNTYPEVQDTLYEMFVRGDDATSSRSRSQDYIEKINVEMTPVTVNGNGTKERVFVVNTKGNKGDNYVAVIEDTDKNQKPNDNVIMTNAGKITKKDGSKGILMVSADQHNNYHPFVAKMDKVNLYTPTESIGEGTEIVIGMEDGRFVNEIEDSIKTFVSKINSGEIVLKPFVAAPNAKDTQLIMLAGGFGSRAEYTNASSSGILHGKKDGAISTKGAFRTATGLTPMETTFVTLHNAGLLDCSKGKLDYKGDNANIKFYLNQSGINKGNGGYSVDLVKTMQREGRKQVIIFPNDSMSRMTNAVKEANRLVANGTAAIAMVAKEVPAKDCIKTFGIMKLGEGNEILEFAEKPAVIPEGYEKGGNCLTNTFQFAVSDQAFEVLSMMEPFFSTTDKDKESRDWSKQFVPIIKTLTQDEDKETIKKNLAKVFKVSYEQLEDNRHDINSTIDRAKAILGNQKLVAVPTSEPWADCGTLNALYDTTMKIASGQFPLEDFERANVLSSVNTQTGLIASSKEQKEEIEAKYDIEGQVMAVKQAKKVNDEDVADIPVAINR